MDDAATPPLPESIGLCRLRRKLAAGPASEVYEAVYEPTNAPAALKILSHDMVHDADAIERIGREAEVLQKLKHPNIIGLLDHGTAPDGRPYLVFEYVHGATLQQILDRRLKPDWESGLSWMLDAAEALSEAWRHHIIHRDVKPANMIIQRDLTLRLGDFGLAKEVYNPDQAADRALVGSPRYISPEMATGLSLDFRADMYSLGACFYHYFTGQAPFEAPSNRELLQKHATAPLVPPYAVEPSLPQDICDILEHLLRKDPSDRYQNYGDLESDLREARLAIQVAGGQRQDFDMTAIIGKSPFLLEPTERERASGARTVSARTVAASAPPPPVIHPKPRIHPMEVDPLNPPGEDPAVAVVQRREALKARIKLWVGLGFLVFAGLYFFQPSWMRAQGSKPSWLAGKLTVLLGGRPENADTGRLLDENKQRMESLMSVLIQFDLRQNRFPNSLEEGMKGSGLDAALLNDAWGTPYLYDAGTRQLRSCGMDAKPNTADDFLLNEKLEFKELPDISTTFGRVGK